MSMTVQEISQSLSGIKAKEAVGNAYWANRDARRHWLKAHGWKRIGAGAFKEVFAHDEHNFVVKIHAPDGCKEVENYKSAPEHIKEFLLPVMSHGEGWMIQRRVDLSHAANGFAGDWDKLQEFCRSHGCPGWIPGMQDSGSHNHTHRSNGRLVIYDYGQSGQWYKVSPEEFARYDAQKKEGCMNVAAKVRKEKEQHPERFCSIRGCLWRVTHRDGRVTPCKKHVVQDVYDRWAKWYDGLNGAPESEDDR